MTYDNHIRFYLSEDEFSGLIQILDDSGDNDFIKYKEMLLKYARIDDLSDETRFKISLFPNEIADIFRYLLNKVIIAYEVDLSGNYAEQRKINYDLWKKNKEDHENWLHD